MSSLIINRNICIISFGHLKKSCFCMRDRTTNSCTNPNFNATIIIEIIIFFCSSLIVCYNTYISISQYMIYIYIHRLTLKITKTKIRTWNPKTV